MKNLTKIIALINKYWTEIKSHLFKVEVDNLPDVQKVEVTNPQEPQATMEVSNFDEVRKALNENAVNIIEVLEKQMIELKVEPTDNSDIIKGLKEIKEKIKIEKDLTPEVIKRLESIGKEIGKLDTKPDLSGLESHLEASYSLIESLKDYTEYDEWKVKINGKQMEELVKAMGKTMISASGTGIIKDGQGNPFTTTNPLPIVGDIEITQEKESSANSNTKVSVGNTSTTIIALNASRRFVLIVNDSDEDIYLNLSGTAVINEGIRINANGGNYYEDIYTGIITGICASGSKNVTIVEV
jgi:hypothetical protein|tara:strand:- start:638 stop:1531 length:894 start_codon:yes stop_codon:yes gene_type:complete